MTFNAHAAKRLAKLVDQERVDQLLLVQDVAEKAGVSRAMVSRLINHAEIPGRRVKRDAIAAALGWEPGTFDAVLAGAQVTVAARAGGEDTHAGGSPIADVDIAAAKRLASAIDDARNGIGLSKLDLSRLAGVSRPVVSRLINHAEVPANRSVRDALGAALGWEPGSCDAVLAGGEPTLRATARASLLLAERLREIAAEADAAAADSDQLAKRWREIGDSARAAAELALRGGGAIPVCGTSRQGAQ
ncbi:LacI family DNA-binding transcriptional regulator [Mycobacteroides abscessus subsp. abscessus]|nr:LacI family DNA-binding transcriptional regulator [Mycobacteroides abscessus subsp. abscessus]